MTTSWLIDTNVLIYSFDQSCQFHKLSYNFISFAISSEFDLFISHQNLLEFLGVVTNPKRVNRPISIDDAFQKIAIYETTFNIISPKPETFLTFRKLIARYPAFRERIFDLYLAATALDNNINQICTWNKKDFQRISEINTKTPEEITF